VALAEELRLQQRAYDRKLAEATKAWEQRLDELNANAAEVEAAADLHKLRADQLELLVWRAGQRIPADLRGGSVSLEYGADGERAAGSGVRGRRAAGVAGDEDAAGLLQLVSGFWDRSSTLFATALGFRPLFARSPTTSPRNGSVDDADHLSLPPIAMLRPAGLTGTRRSGPHSLDQVIGEPIPAQVLPQPTPSVRLRSEASEARTGPSASAAPPSADIPAPRPPAPAPEPSAQPSVPTSLHHDEVPSEPPAPADAFSYSSHYNFNPALGMLSA